MAVLCRAYMVDSKSYIRCGHYFLAQGITESQVKAVCASEEGAARLAAIEEFLGKLFRFVDLSTTNGAMLKGVAALFCRVGQLILRVKKEVDSDDFATAELTFRKAMSEAGAASLPPVILQMTQQMITKAEEGASAKGLPARSGPTPSADAALSFDADGALVENLAFKANQRGIVQGGRVRCIKDVPANSKHQGVKRGAVGWLAAFKTAAVEVLWETGQGCQPESIKVPLGCIEALAEGEGKPNAGVEGDQQQGKTDGATIQTTPPRVTLATLTWTLVDATSAWHYLVAILQSTLFHLHATCGSGPDRVARVGPGLTGGGTVHAVVKFEKLSVCLVPYSRVILPEKPTGIRPCPRCLHGMLCHAICFLDAFFELAWLTGSVSKACYGVPDAMSHMACILISWLSASWRERGVVSSSLAY